MLVRSARREGYVLQQPGWPLTIRAFRTLPPGHATHLRAMAGMLLVLLCAIGTPVQAATPQVSVGLEKDEIYSGESVIYQVTVQNARNASKPDVSALNKDFTVKLEGSRPESSTSITMINGVMTRRETYNHIYQYSLTPKRAGLLELPPPTVTFEGKELRGNATRLRVVAPEKQDWVLSEINVEPQKVFPTQPFQVKLQISMRPLPDDPSREPITLLRRLPALIAPWLKEPPENAEPATNINDQLRGLLDSGRSGFYLEGFTVKSNDPFASFFPSKAVVRPKAKRVARTCLDGQRRSYFVYEFPITYSAAKPGDYTFGPSMIKGNFITGVRGASYQLQRLVISVPAVTVSVIDPLTLNPPADFSGAIGHFELRATANPVRLRVGDPLTLTLTVVPFAGGGSLDLISAPKLTEQEAVTKGFQIIDDQPVGEVENGRKLFRYSLRPKEQVKELPSISMTYFDPQTKRFAQARSEPIPLQVTEAAKMGATEMVTGSRPASASGELRSISGGIRQNITDLAALGDQRSDIRFFILLPFALLISYSLLSLLVHRHRARSSDIGLQRRQNAVKTARGLLAKATENPDQAPTFIRSALLGLVADLANLPAAGMTPREGDLALTRMGAGEASRKELSSILESLEAMAYGGASASDAEALSRKAEALVVRVRKEVGK